MWTKPAILKGSVVLRLLAGIAFPAVIFVGLACGSGEEPEAPAPGTAGGVLRVSSLDPTRWDMHGTGLGNVYTLMAPVFNVLITENSDDIEVLEGNLAKSWSIGTDGKTYTFPLHEDVQWHDGKPFTAADVVASMEKIISPPEGLRSARKALFGTVESVEAVDDNTVAFNLEFPDAAFLEILAIGWNVIYPRHILDQFGLDVMDAVGFENKVGTGPFKPTTYRLNEIAVLERNPNYFREGLPLLDGVEIRHIPDVNTQLSSLMTGALDYILVDGEQAQVVEKQEGTDLIVGRTPLLSPFVLYINVTKSPWDDIRVRQAVSEAIDRQAVNDLIIEGGSAGGHVLPGSKWDLAPEELQKMPGYGPDMDVRRANARELLKQAGFTEANPLVMNLTVRPTPDSDRIGTIVAPMFEEVGIEVNIKPVPIARQAEMRVKGEFEITVNNLSQTGIDPTHLFGTYLHCDVPRNQSRTCIPELDDLWLDQRTETNFDKRKVLVDEMHKKYLEQASWNLISWRNGLWAAKDYVKVLRLTSKVYTSHQRLETTWLDK